MRNQIEAVTQTLSAAPAFLYGTEKELNTLADDAALSVCNAVPDATNCDNTAHQRFS